MSKKLSPKQLQQICEAILKAQGKNYKDWLYEKQQELLIESGDLIAAALTKGGNEQCKTL